MDVDLPIPGPSNEPVIFEPPPAPPIPHTYLASTHDLLARFHLLSAYDTHVRPLLDHVPPSPKGKEREKDPDPDDDDHTEKKKKNNYRHLIKGVPGKHSMKKDSYLTTIMQVPPKERISIVPFDARTQADAFTVSPDGLKNWNPSVLVVESPQAREDRKRRKELKKLAKAQAAHPQQQQPPSATPISATVAAAASPVRIGTPKPVPPTRPTAIKSESPFHPPLTHPASPALAPTPSSIADKDQRGKKREYDNGLSDQPMPTTIPPTPASTTTVIIGAQPIPNGVVLAAPPRPVLNAKAGIPGVRPRPVKKQRMDNQGRARDVSVSVPVQQPTPRV